MSRKLLLLITGVLLAMTVQGQDEAPTDDTGTEVSGEAGEASEVGEADEDGELEDSDLDEQTYEGDEDDFVPSEEIPADEPIPFPSDI